MVGDRTKGSAKTAQGERTSPTHSMPPAMLPLLMPQPPLAPLAPPVHAVELMTEAGSSIRMMPVPKRASSAI